jgi:hypothetical protein
VEGTTGEGAALAFSLGRRGIRKPLWWRARQVRALFRPLFARSALTQPATVVAGTTGEGAGLAYDRLIDVGPGSHCGGGHER